MKSVDQENSDNVIVAKHSVAGQSIQLTNQDHIFGAVLAMFPEGPEAGKHGARQLVAATPFAWSFYVDPHTKPIPEFHEEVVLYTEWLGSTGTEYWYMRLHRNPGNGTHSEDWRFADLRATGLFNDLILAKERPNELELVKYIRLTYFGNRTIFEDRVPIKVVSLVNSSRVTEELAVAISKNERARVFNTYFQGIARPIDLEYFKPRSKD